MMKKILEIKSEPKSENCLLIVVVNVSPGLCFKKISLHIYRSFNMKILEKTLSNDIFYLRNKMNTFERTFYSTLPPKTINNRAITGSIFLNLAYEYVNAMNNGKIPKIMNSLESVIASEVRKVCDSYKSNYKNAMD